MVGILCRGFSYSFEAWWGRFLCVTSRLAEIGSIISPFYFLSHDVRAGFSACASFRFHPYFC